MSSRFKEGINDSVPFGIGFVFLYLAMGMQSFTQQVSLSQVLAMTTFIFSTPLQFLLIQSKSVAVFVIIPIVLAMNARFLLMSGMFAPNFKSVRLVKLLFSTILIVPSVFTGCMVQFKKNTLGAFEYFLGLGLPIYLVSIVCVVIGFLLGHQLRSPLLYAMMPIVLPLQFTALAAKHWPDHKQIFSYWLGFVCAPMLIYLFKEYNLLLTPFVIALVVIAYEEVRKKVLRV